MVANQGRDGTDFAPDDDDDDHVPVVDEEMPRDEDGRLNPFASHVPKSAREGPHTPSGAMRSLPPQAPLGPALEIPPTPHRPMHAAPPSGERPGANPSGHKGPPQAPLAAATPSPGAPLASPTPVPSAPLTFEQLAPGAVLDDKYVIGVKLGQGGMGAVFRARHKLLGKDVALKVITPQMADNHAFKQRFSREAKVAMEFVHRHAVPLRDFGVTAGGLFYMTMDFSPGRSLRALVEKDGALEPSRACRIVSQMLDALQEAHRKHIIHRDLKPDNVMIEEDDRSKDFVKVLDFGLAKIAGATGEESAAGPSLASGEAILGTPAYMSPEQATGEDVDPRTDLYACGVVLYQLLTGDLPFKANTTRQMIMKQVASAPPPLKQVKPDIALPDGLEALVLRSLAKERGDRFQTAEEFKAALAPYCDPNLKASVGSGTIASERPQNSAAALGCVEIAVGLTIDRYKILEKIAEGGFGAVFRAEHVLMHRACAFKVMKAGLSEDEEFSTRFQREAQVASKFKHPNAVEVYDFGKVGTQLFMAMELVEGKPLTHRIRGRIPPPIALRDAVEIMCQALDVLEAAHKAGIVHRDLKPDNIMLNVVEGWPNQVKVLDFGIAKMKGIGDAADYATQAGSFFGTPQYASPEQCRGELGIDGRSDIYSMGIILFEMLSGKLPFESETAAGFLACHMVTPPRRVREVKPEAKLPEGVEQVIQKALAKKREDRYQGAREFADALKRAAGMHPLFEIGDKGVKVASSRNSRPESFEVEPAKGFGLTVAGVLIAVLALVFWLFVVPSKKPEVPTVLRLATGVPGVRVVIIGTGIDGSLILDTGPDGTVESSLPGGTYSVALEKKPRFEAQTIYNIVVKKGERVERAVKLEPAKAGPGEEADRAREGVQRARDEAAAGGAQAGAPEEWKQAEDALAQGDKHVDSERYADAVVSFASAKAAYEAARDKAAEARRIAGARLSRERDDCQAARDEAKKAGAEEQQADLYRQASDRHGEAADAANRGEAAAAAAKFAEASALYRQAVAAIAASQEASAFSEQAGTKLRALGEAARRAKAALDAVEPARTRARQAGAPSAQVDVLDLPLGDAQGSFAEATRLEAGAREKVKDGADKIAPGERGALLESLDTATRRYDEARTGFEDVAAKAQKATDRAKLKSALAAGRGEAASRRAEYETALAAAKPVAGIQLGTAEVKAAKAEAQATLGASLADIAIAGMVPGGDEGGRALAAFTQAASLYVEAAADVRAAEAAAKAGPSTPAPSDPASDRAAIDKLLQAFKAAYEAKDLDALAACYADMGAAQRRDYQKLFANEDVSYEVRLEAPTLKSADFGYTYYRLFVSGTEMSKRPQVFLRKAGGAWRISTQ